MFNKIVDVPEMFRFVDHFPYPEDNIFDFEYWLSTAIKEDDITGERCYLPITWTAFYKLYNYGQDINAISGLQSYLQSLPRDKKYFSVCQYDSGILNNLSDLDIKVFSMAGKPMDYPLPLICQPHYFEDEDLFFDKRKFLFCFTGAITHPIRKEIIDRFLGIDNVIVSSLKTNLFHYCSILARSVFSLCPRGFSQNSFRIMESLQRGSIPIYISDEFIEPHNIDFNTYGIKIHLSGIKDIPVIVREMSKEKIKELQEVGKQVYKDYFTFEANRNLILKNINSI